MCCRHRSQLDCGLIGHPVAQVSLTKASQAHAQTNKGTQNRPGDAACHESDDHDAHQESDSYQVGRQERMEASLGEQVATLLL